MSSKGRKLFVAKYSYDPYQGPNEHPEFELPLAAGEYIYINGAVDEDGFYEGKLHVFVFQSTPGLQVIDKLIIYTCRP